MSIVFSGGGTAGSLTSLLSVAKKVRMYRSDIPLHVIAPSKSIGRSLTEQQGVEWHEIHAVKLHRFFTLANILIPIRLVVSFFEAFSVLIKLDATVVVTAGSYVSPPLVWAAYLRGIKIVLIQLDVKPGLANRLTKPFANLIYTSWKEHSETYPRGEYVGILIDEEAHDYPLPFKLTKDVILVTVLGGGTGAQALNELVWSSLPGLTKNIFIVHITGKNKMKKGITHHNYLQYDFIDAPWFQTLLKKSVLIVSRAGMGAIADGIRHNTPMVLIPIPRSHQEENARQMETIGAAKVISQNELTYKKFTDIITKLTASRVVLKEIKASMLTLKNEKGYERIANGILNVYEKKHS